MTHPRTSSAAPALGPAIDSFPDDAPLTVLGRQLPCLETTLSRMTVLSAMHPDLTIGDPMPRHAMPPDEDGERFMTVAALELTARMPTEPAIITLQTQPPFEDGTVVDEMRHWLNGRTVTANASGFTYTLFIDWLITAIAERYLPVPDDDSHLHPGLEFETGPGREARRRTFGPRRQDSRE